MSRYALSLSWLTTVALTMLPLIPSSWVLGLNIPSLGVAPESCFVFFAVVPGVSGSLFEGIAASWVSSLTMVSCTGSTRLAFQQDVFSRGWDCLYNGREFKLRGDLRPAEVQ